MTSTRGRWHWYWYSYTPNEPSQKHCPSRHQFALRSIHTFLRQSIHILTLKSTYPHTTTKSRQGSSHITHRIPLIMNDQIIPPSSLQHQLQRTPQTLLRHPINAHEHTGSTIKVQHRHPAGALRLLGFCMYGAAPVSRPGRL
jgi:hypothetical protein